MTGKLLNFLPSSLLSLRLCQGKSPTLKPLQKVLKTFDLEFPLRLSSKPTSTHEDAGSSPGPAQWVKDPALPQTAKQAAEGARIWHCCGCDSTAHLGTAIGHQGHALKKKKGKEKKKPLGF